MASHIDVEFFPEDARPRICWVCVGIVVGLAGFWSLVGYSVWRVFHG